MNKIKDYDIDGIFSGSDTSETYRIEAAKIEFAEDICRCMDDHGMNRRVLAQKIGCSPAYITKILRGNANFTIESMVKIARALAVELRCNLQSDIAIANFEFKYEPTETRVDLANEIKKYPKVDYNTQESGDSDDLALTA